MLMYINSNSTCKNVKIVRLDVEMMFELLSFNFCEFNGYLLFHLSKKVNMFISI